MQQVLLYFLRIHSLYIITPIYRPLVIKELALTVDKKTIL